MAYFKFPIWSLNGNEFITQVITDTGNLHSHDFFEISFVVNGKVKHLTNEKETYLTSDTLIIVRPNDIHAFNEENNPHNCHRDIIATTKFFKSVCDFVSPTVYEKIISYPSVIFCNMQRPAFDFLQERLSYYASAKKQNSELAKSIAISALSIIINIFLTTESLQTNNNADIYLQILQTMSLPIVLREGISTLLKTLNYSHGHICRIIKTCSGKTLLKTLTEKRMEYAANLLKSTDYTLLDISSAVGYNSLSHFITEFKKEIGVSPIKYKKNQIFDRSKTNTFGLNEI